MSVSSPLVLTLLTFLPPLFLLLLERTATKLEIKKAYRHMAKKYHPDKLQHLSVELQNGGKEKFQKMQEAYDGLKKERNFS